MADQKQEEEFLGGGPKFNVVGKDNRPVLGEEVPSVSSRSAGDWLRLSGVILVVAALAVLLLYLNDQNLGKTQVAPNHGGQSLSPDAKNVPVPSNLQ